MQQDDKHIEVLSSTQYFNELLLVFTDLSEKIENEDSIHFKMERFADYTIELIKKADLNELKKCFDFQEVRINNLSPELENAMTVSYCESLLLGEVGKLMHNFTKYMNPKLFKMYTDYEVYYNNLGKSIEQTIT